MVGGSGRPRRRAEALVAQGRPGTRKEAQQSPLQSFFLQRDGGLGSIFCGATAVAYGRHVASGGWCGRPHAS